ncbi:hypothetical protein CDL12_07613 [Handroanthus impetiginosus]|uniref:Protein SCAR n=1 Tax=Handroanthus impetiginosus TaxID=429701 RepID=A0A2G9HQA3_9LAMI|nr:hypothetical protein CDL12_07613 [Handroanthus impetiginosus]
MPMVRYEIRNEYSLADPELYRAADKDDPEALLEGVAMAGLVGVLRQLGDLAEFAAEIFHNLHEEVMATAARGHSLMTRVQQLETEVPYIERAFLSQTDHSSFFYHAGVDWHPNLQIDQSLVTQGDLPRFIMDSYEECRAPPRLFLLDKFDVAGAGACLKRYTDPSFFKVETSEMTTADVQREKKIRKAKKKGPRWRNGETPEVQPTSHAKLHQLFLEERVENGVGNPSRRAKLKRRLNGFPFDLRPGKSYMEKLLKSPSPDHKVLHEVTLNSSRLMVATNDVNLPGLEVLEVRSVSPDRESVGRKRSPPSSPDRDEIMLNSFKYKTSEVPVDEKISDLPSSYPSTGTDNISSIKVTGEKVIAVDAENNVHDRLTGDQSDGIASEVDDYVDAPSIMESEMDMDSELRVKNDFTSSHNKNQLLASNANEERFHSSSSDSRSTGDSTISDEGNNSSRKEMYSSSSSNSPSTSAENLQPEEFSAKGFPSADVPEIEIVDTSSHEKIVGEDLPIDQHSKPVVPDDTCPGTDAITNHKAESEQLSSCLCSNQSIYTTVSSDSGVMQNGMLKGPESDEMASTLDDNRGPESYELASTLASTLDDNRGPESDEMASTLDDREQKRNLAIDPLCSPSVSDFVSPSGDDSPRSCAGELVDEPIGEIVRTVSTVPGVHSRTTDSIVTISSSVPHEDESDKEHQNLVEDIASPLNKLNVFSVNPNVTSDIISFENLIQGKSDDYPDIAHNGGNIKSMVSEGEYLIDELDNDNPNVCSNAPNCIPSNLDDSLGKKLEETSPVGAQTVDAEETQSNSSIENQVSLENVRFSDLANFLDWPRACSDAYAGDDIPEGVTTLNETLPLGTPKTSEVVGLRGTAITGGIPPDDPEALGSSFSTPEDREERGRTSPTVEKDGITPCTDSTGQEVPEISDSADPESVNEVPVSFSTPEDPEEPGRTSHTVEKDGITPCMDSTGEEVPEISDSDPESVNEVPISFSTPEDPEEPGRTSHTVEKDGITPCMDSTGEEVPEISDSADPESVNEVRVPLDESHSEEDRSYTADMASAVPAVSENAIVDNVLNKLVEEHNFCLEDSGLYGLENDKNSASGSHGEASMVEKVSQTKDDHPKSEVSDTGPNSYLDHAATIQPLLERSGMDTEQEVFQQNGLGNHVSDAPFFPVDYEAEESMVQEKIGLPPSQLDQEMPHSGETSSELSPSLPNNHQQMPDHDDRKENNNAASMFSLISYQGPPSVSDISRLSNYGLSVPGYPMDPLGSVVSPSNPFSGTNHINVDDLPPLPPLPPVQWRMGKLQHASSSTGGEMTKHKELFPQLISPPTASTNDVSSAPLAPSTDAVHSSPRTTSTDEASFLLEEAKHSAVQTAPETASEEKLENSCSSLTATIIPVTALKEEKVENSSSSLGASVSKEREVENSCTSLEASVISETILKEKKVENSCSTLDASVLHETVDLPQEVENKKQQQQFVMPTLESELTSPADEDGVANGNRTVKLPRRRNPLIDDVAALDKSKLRKVTERVRPQAQKVDERDSLLEQIRTKSFNLKPAIVSRPSIRGPNTNLRVAAILEKANAIRQAFAGSDEDDDDSWSDS